MQCTQLLRHTPILRVAIAGGQLSWNSIEFRDAYASFGKYAKRVKNTVWKKPTKRELSDSDGIPAQKSWNHSRLHIFICYDHESQINYRERVPYPTVQIYSTRLSHNSSVLIFKTVFSHRKRNLKFNNTIAQHIHRRFVKICGIQHWRTGTRVPGPVCVRVKKQHTAATERQVT